jgi:hypothetical protein
VLGLTRDQHGQRRIGRRRRLHVVDRRGDLDPEPARPGEALRVEEEAQHVVADAIRLERHRRERAVAVGMALASRVRATPRTDPSGRN